MKFVIFHGAHGHAKENWFPYLAHELEKLNQSVIVPNFPTPENQNLASWFSVFEDIKKDFDQEQLCFVGHSLGPLFILHAVNRYNIQLKDAVFVGPFFEPLGIEMFDRINETFYQLNFDFNRIKKLIPNSYVVYSDNDHIVQPDKSLRFAEKLGSEIIKVKNGGHLNAAAGFTTFPLVLELCRKRIT